MINIYRKIICCEKQTLSFINIDCKLSWTNIFFFNMNELCSKQPRLNDLSNHVACVISCIRNYTFVVCIKLSLVYAIYYI